MLCLSCGHLTAPAASCAHCGEALEVRREPPVQRGPLDLLERLICERREGLVTAEGLQAAIVARRRELQEVLEGLERAEIPPDMAAEVADELRTGRSGILALWEALGALEAWAVDGGEGELERALALGTQACAHLNHAVAMNWRAFRTYQESAEEYLEQIGYRPPSG